MTQKAVINVPMKNQKARSKAMKIVVGVYGVNSAALAGPDKTQLEVTGDGIDSVALVTLLRKKIGSAELVSFGPATENQDGGDGDKAAEEDDVSGGAIWPNGYYGGGDYLYHHQMRPVGGQYYTMW